MKRVIFVLFPFLVISTSFSQEIYEVKEKEIEVELSGQKGKKVELIKSYRTSIEGNLYIFILRREHLLGNSKRKVAYIIDRYSREFEFQKSIDITEVFDEEEEKSTSVYPGKPKMEILFRGERAYIFNHAIVSGGKYQLHAHVLDTKNMQLGERKNLVRLDVNKKNKAIHGHVDVSENGSFIGLALLPTDVDHMDQKTLFRVYDQDFNLVYSKKNKEEVFAFSNQRFNINDKGEICLLGWYRRVKLTKDSTILKQNEDSIFFGGFYHRLPSRWMATEFNVQRRVKDGIATYVSYFFNNEDKYSRKLVFLQYDINKNEILTYKIIEKGPNVDLVSAIDLLTDEQGNWYLIGARKHIMNDLFINNKNRALSSWYFGNIWCSKFDSNGDLLYLKQIQREYEGAFGHKANLVPVVTGSHLFVLYKDTKRGLRVYKDKSKTTLTWPNSSTLNAYGLGVIDNAGMVKRYQLGIDLKEPSPIKGVSLLYRFLPFGNNAIVYLPKQKELKQGKTILRKIELP